MSVDRLAGAIRREESVEVSDRNTGAENFEIHEEWVPLPAQSAAVMPST
jgi:hypothetical protein